jgi:hypothetical protein
LQPAFRHELAEGSGFFRVPFQERFHIGDLVKHEPIARLHLQEMDRFENVGQAHVEVFLACLEDGSFQCVCGMTQNVSLLLFRRDPLPSQQRGAIAKCRR